MKKYAFKSAISVLLAVGGLPSFAEDIEHYLSVVPRTNGVVKPISKSTSLSAAAKSARESALATQKALATGKSSSSSNQKEEAKSESSAPESPAESAVSHTFYSAALEQTVKQYRANPNDLAYAQILDAFKTTLAGAGTLRVSPAVIVKDNPYLTDFKPRVIEANGLRIWSFPKVPDHSCTLVQWYETHQQVIGVGRRKKVVATTSLRIQNLSFVQPMNVKDAGIVSTKENGQHLLLAGDGEDGSLAVQAYKLVDAAWQASPEYLLQIPSFLSSNVSGRISFRGTDLIYNVGKMILTTDSSGTKRFLPEAESATYKFWLKSTDAGYVVAAAVADEEAFSGVFQFMQAVQQSRTDVEKALLADTRLSSLPKYLGLQGKPLDSSTRVVEMSVPAARGERFRLINIGKDDLIFDVGKVKGQWQVKALFIAAPDPFLAETSKYFPLYSSFVQKSETKSEAQDKKDTKPDGYGGLGAGSGISSVRKKR